MKTPEQIAREAAERVISFDGWNHQEENRTFTKIAGKLIHTFNVGLGTVKELQEHIERTIILAAIETALRQCPVPSPVSEEQLAGIRNANDRVDEPWSHMDVTNCINKLFTHIDHLHHIMRVPESQEYAKGYDDGRKQALAEVRELVADMRRYILFHGLLLGECVAWDRLKKMTGVGND